MKHKLSLEEVRKYFPDFSEPALQQDISDCGTVHYFEADEVIMDYGSYIKMLPLILSGTLKVSREGDDGSELFLYYLSRGESCTMTFSCCMSNKQSEIRAVAEENTSILALPQQKLDEWMMRYKSWKNFVMLAYDQRMNELIATIDQVTFNQLDERLYEYIKKRAGIKEDNIINTTHQLIADDLHASREAISRLLKVLEKRGVISLGRNRIELL